VWAPLARQVTVAFEDAARAPLTLAPEPAGYFSGTWPGGTAGALYRYRLDERGPYPDPCSYYQPRGPHGASMVVDPAE
jgi:maltooligosyltrehalose trehalohydrolase